jgi:thioredoxin
MKGFRFILFVTVALLSASIVFSQTVNRTEADTFGEVITLTHKEFIETIYNYEVHKDSFVYEGSLPCIIDFYADWCAPCKKVEPILKDLAKEYKGKVNIYKINVDKERALATVFGIQSIPTYFFVTNKGELQYAMGALPRETFVRVINEVLLKKE